jgi:hypothetical protein
MEPVAMTLWMRGRTRVLAFSSRAPSRRARARAPMHLSMSFKALWITAALAPLFALYALNRWNRPLEPSTHVLGVLERLGAGQDLRPSPDHRQFLSRPWFAASATDTTAVVLNWSRFSNVLDIAAVLCHPALADTIAEVLVWNNSPNKISVKVNDASSSTVGMMLKSLKLWL